MRNPTNLHAAPCQPTTLGGVSTESSRTSRLDWGAHDRTPQQKRSTPGQDRHGGWQTEAGTRQAAASDRVPRDADRRGRTQKLCQEYGRETTIADHGHADRQGDDDAAGEPQTRFEIHALEAAQDDADAIFDRAEREEDDRERDGGASRCAVTENGGEAGEQRVEDDGGHEPEHDAGAEQCRGSARILRNRADDIVLLAEVGKDEGGLYEGGGEVEHAIVVSAEMPGEHGGDGEGDGRSGDLAGDQEQGVSGNAGAVSERGARRRSALGHAPSEATRIVSPAISAPLTCRIGRRRPLYDRLATWRRWASASATCDALVGAAQSPADQPSPDQDEDGRRLAGGPERRSADEKTADADGTGGVAHHAALRARLIATHTVGTEAR